MKTAKEMCKLVKVGLEYVCDTFRSLYLHEALPSFDKSEKKEFVTIVQHRLLFSKEKKLIIHEIE